MYNVYRTCEIGQLRVMVQTLVSGNEARVAGWGNRPARWSPSAQVATVVRASGGRRSILRVHLSSPLRLSVRAYSERETGWREEAPDLPYPVSRSQSRTSVNDAHRWKLYTPPGIHVRRLCGDVMYVHVCHWIRRMDRDNAERTAVDIKAHTPLIRFVVDLLLVCCI